MFCSRCWNSSLGSLQMNYFSLTIICRDWINLRVSFEEKSLFKSKEKNWIRFVLLVWGVWTNWWIELGAINLLPKVGPLVAVKVWRDREQESKKRVGLKKYAKWWARGTWRAVRKKVILIEKWCPANKAFWSVQHFSFLSQGEELITIQSWFFSFCVWRSTCK